MGVAVLTLSVWLLNQRETTSRTQWGGGGGTVSKHQGEGKAPVLSNTQGILLSGVYQIPVCPRRALLVAEVRGLWGVSAAPHAYMGDHTQQQGSHQTLGEPGVPDQLPPHPPKGCLLSSPSPSCTCHDDVA